MTGKIAVLTVVTAIRIETMTAEKIDTVVIKKMTEKSILQNIAVK